MAFENINVALLKQDLIRCKNSINYSASKNLYQEMQSSNYWQSDVKRNMQNCFNKLINAYYEDLKKTIEKYESVIAQISNYQDLQKENNALQNNYNNLNGKLYQEEQYTESTYNETTKKYEDVTKTKMVKNEKIEKKMQNIQNNINSNKSEMTILESRIKNLV